MIKVSLFLVSYSCGGNETGFRGNLSSPGYPGNYEPQTHCHWSVHVSEGHVIRLTIDDLDLETSQGCVYDFILVSTVAY